LRLHVFIRSWNQDLIIFRKVGFGSGDKSFVIHITAVGSKISVFRLFLFSFVKNQISILRHCILFLSDSGRLLFGTVDSWLIWNLTGRSAHLTDVTNASRTMLMDIHSLAWDPFLLRFFDIPPAILPEIRSSAEHFGRLRLSRLAASGENGSGVPIAGCLGDQQAALLGQHCLAAGQTKATYGTGCFLLTNIGTMPVISRHGLLTTVAFRLGPAQPAYYSLEGSIGQAGSALDWLRSIGIEPSEEGCAAPTSAVGHYDGAHSVHVVPGFGGLLAPRWRPDARASITGKTTL
jgi:glycerol kinase